MKTSTATKPWGASASKMCLHALLLFAFTLFLTPSSFAQAPGDGEALDGVINVKLNEQASKSLAISKSGGVALTGIATVDQLNSQYQVGQMERVFRPAGKFESQHQAWGLDRWYRMQYDTEASPEDVASSYLNDPSVESASPVYGKELHVLPPADDEDPAVIPNDPEYETQWHYDNTGQTNGTPDADINLPEAHDITTGDPGVIISIVDSGLDLDHPEFQGMLWINSAEDANGNGVFDPEPVADGGDLDGIDNDNNGFVDDVVGYDHADNDPIPDGNTGGSHGTHVAGTVAAKNGNGQFGAGVAGGDGTANSGARLMINQTFSNSVGGFAEAIVYAADMGAIVSQNSWGYTSAGSFDQAVLDAIDYFRANAGGPGEPMDGGIFVNSSGNSKQQRQLVSRLLSALLCRERDRGHGHEEPRTRIMATGLTLPRPAASSAKTASGAPSSAASTPSRARRWLPRTSRASSRSWPRPTPASPTTRWSCCCRLQARTSAA